MECLWYLCNKNPSIDTPGRTIMEEAVDANKEHKIVSNERVLYNQGQIYEQIKDFRMSKELSEKMIEMMKAPEETIEDVTIDEFFGDTAEELYKSSMWICFHSMLAFKHYHSLIEMKRYMVRFIQHLPGIEYLKGQIETKHNEYDSVIKPIKKWLLDRGVTIITDCSVDMDNDCNIVTGIKARKNGEEIYTNVAPDDAVIVTIGSMITNSCMGDNKTIATTNRNKDDMGLFDIWQNLAKKNSKFGHPEKFISDIDKTKWISCMVTVKDYPEFFDRMYKKLKATPGHVTGAVTILDSSWDISFVLYGKHYPYQKENEQVFWFDTLYGERNGDYIKKPSTECTGEEILTEFLYHMGMLDIKDEVLAHTYISTCMMPYITSQFMPRKIADRPKVIPDGCKNLALIGQYVELPGDVVFTVETSVRTAMMAAYGLLNLDRQVMPLYEAQYDTRILTMCLKKMLGTDKLSLESLPKINPLKIKEETKDIFDFVNSMPEISDEDNI